MPVQPRAPVIIVVAMTALVGVALPGQTLLGQTSSDSAFDTSYRHAQQKHASLKTLTARFSETTTSSLLARPLVSHGTLAVERPARIALRYADPESRVVLIDGDRLTVTWPSRQLTQQTDIRRALSRVQRYFIGGDVDALRGEFTIEPQAASTQPGTDQVRLRPKRRQIRETLSALDLWVDPATALPVTMRMTFANGDTKTMTFEDVAVNPPLPAGTFSAAR